MTRLIWKERDETGANAFRTGRLPAHGRRVGRACPRRFPPLQQHQRPRQRRAAYTNGANWVSEGWWNIKASNCETLLRGPLAAQYYYIYAMDERGGQWKGKAFMCTRDREFRIEGREDCFVRGFDRSGFFEVDTGKDAKNWTVQLTDPGPAALIAKRQEKPDNSIRGNPCKGADAAARSWPRSGPASNDEACDRDACGAPAPTCFASI